LVVEFSKDAAKYLVACDKRLKVFSSDDDSLIREIVCEGIRASSFSPLGGYILTFQRPMKTEEGHFQPNLKLWGVQDGECLIELNQKELDRDHWPNIQFTRDEKHCVHRVTNTLHVYDLSANLGSAPCLKFPVKGVSKFSLSPTASMDSPESMLVMTYVPEIKGTPGYLALHRIRQCQQDNAPAPIARKSFFRANSVRFLWNSIGTAVLIIAAADVDATNQSYYGEQKLFFFSEMDQKTWLCPCQKRAQSMMFNGHQKVTSLLLFLVICQQNQPYSMTCVFPSLTWARVHTV